MGKKAILIAATAGMLLSATGIWVGTHPAPITFGMNEQRDELVVRCENARTEDSQDIGIIPVHDGEFLCVENSIDRGQADVVFTNDTKRVTAHLSPECGTRYGVTTQTGNWSVRFVPSEDGTKGAVSIYKKGVSDVIADPVEDVALDYVERDGAEVISDSPVRTK